MGRRSFPFGQAYLMGQTVSFKERIPLLANYVATYQAAGLWRKTWWWKVIKMPLGWKKKVLKKISGKYIIEIRHMVNVKFIYSLRLQIVEWWVWPGCKSFYVYLHIFICIYINIYQHVIHIPIKRWSQIVLQSFIISFKHGGLLEIKIHWTQSMTHHLCYVDLMKSMGNWRFFSSLFLERE